MDSGSWLLLLKAWKAQAIRYREQALSAARAADWSSLCTVTMAGDLAPEPREPGPALEYARKAGSIPDVSAFTGGLLLHDSGRLAPNWRPAAGR